MKANEDTIAACATPNGTAGIGVIRLSGTKSKEIVQQCYSKHIKVPKTLTVGHFLDIDSDNIIDQVCVVYFKGPSSYTGEDCVEIQCHSSPFIIKKILSILIAKGARLAEQGEFSKRALVNGKMTLTQAESVIDLIHCETSLQHRISINRIEGKLFKHIQSIKQEFFTILEVVEASIDFPDEVEPIDRKEVTSVIKKLYQDVTRILSLQDFGKTIENGIHCLIIGKPNVGKSSLFNQLIGEERSIVTDIPGTTRDYVNETINYKGIKIIFYDTAGLRESGDVVEYLGMKKVKELCKKVDLICWVCDVSEPMSLEDSSICEELKVFSNVAVIKNKSDLNEQFKLPEKFNKVFVQDTSIYNDSSVLALKEQIYCYKSIDYKETDLEFLCNIRQESCLIRLKAQLSQLLDGLKNVVHDDVLAIDIRECISTSCELTGDDITEALLDGIFSRFCIGK